MQSRLTLIASVALLLLCVEPAPAQILVPAGSSLSLNGGSLDLAGTSLTIAGSFATGSGGINGANNIDILAGATLDGGSGHLRLSGDWSNAGTFNPDGGTVFFVDGAASSSNVSGSSVFNNLSFISASGKFYVFAVGSTQTIDSALTIGGTPSAGIQFKSSIAGQVANINLLPSGAQNISYVGVSDVHATGQHLAAMLTNDGGSGNAMGWFSAVQPGGSTTVPAPALSAFVLALLILLTAGLGLHRVRRYESFCTDFPQGIS
jgi:hypothetical protein